jgi:PAN domain
VDRPGRDYKNFDAGAPEPERCQTACEQYSQCKAWAMTLSPTGRGNRCWLKNGIPAQVLDQPGIVAGVKGAFMF